MIFTGWYLGTVTSDRLVFLGYCPPEYHGVILRAAIVSAGAVVTPDANNHWKLEIGTWSAGTLTVLAEVSLSTGLSVTGRRLPLPNTPRIPPGATLACAIRGKGAPATAEHLSLALEHGIVGVR